MRIGIFLPNWVGDVTMSTPALRALRNHHGRDAQLVGIMRPNVADVLAGNPWLDEVVLYNKSIRAAEHSWLEVMQRLRSQPLDTLLLLTNSWRTALLARLSGANQRVGFAGEGRGWLLTRRVPRPKDAATGLPLPAVDTYLQLASAMGCPLESPRLELATTVDDERGADKAWQRLGLPPGNDVVVFNSGGAYGAAKAWPAEHFAALAQRIVAEWGCWVLVNCGPAERGAARDIVSLADDYRVVSLADERQLPLGLSKAVIRRGRMLVTTDSGPRYFGIAFGKPVVTLFGPMDPRLTDPHYERETILSLALECQPCMERTCPLGHHRCMRDLMPDTVYEAVVRYLEESTEMSASTNENERIGARLRIDPSHPLRLRAKSAAETPPIEKAGGSAKLDPGHPNHLR